MAFITNHVETIAPEITFSHLFCNKLRKGLSLKYPHWPDLPSEVVILCECASRNTRVF